MDFSLHIGNPRWDTVFNIPRGTNLQKGRRGVYHEITEAAGAITDQFGCYAWSTGETIHYCGSFAKTNKNRRFRSNLEARIHNYLQNHRIKITGNKNTNLMVFEHLREELKTQDVQLKIFRFDSIILGGRAFTFEEYSRNSELVLAVEQLLICSYKTAGESEWNRTPSSKAGETVVKRVEPVTRRGKPMNAHQGLKYEPLKEYLLKVPANEHDKVMTFEKIEEIIGTKLPASAHEYPAWWANQVDKGHVEANAWLDAGWKVDPPVDFSRKRVRFVRK